MPRIHTHGLARISAAVLGAPLTAVLVALALAACLPLADETRLLVGEFSVFPLIVFGSCVALLSQSGLRAWLACGLTAAISALLLGLAQ